MHTSRHVTAPAIRGGSHVTDQASDRSSCVLVLVSIVPLMGQVGTQGSILGSSRRRVQGRAARRGNHRHEPRHRPHADGHRRCQRQLRDPGAADRLVFGHRVDAGLQDLEARRGSSSPSAIAAACRRCSKSATSPRRCRSSRRRAAAADRAQLRADRHADAADSRAAAQHAQPGGARQPGAGHAVHGLGRPGARVHGAGLRHARRTRPSSSSTA